MENDGVSTFRNLENSSRFHVLQDKTYKIDTQSTVSSHHFEMAMPKLNIPLEFSGATGAIAEIRSNNLALLCVHDDLTGGIPSLEYNCRIRYKDN